MNGKSIIDQEIITKLPKEFREDATMSWKLTDFTGKKFDAILGGNILKPLKAIIDYENETFNINGSVINFIKTSPYDGPYDGMEINQLYTIS